MNPSVRVVGPILALLLTLFAPAATLAQPALAKEAVAAAAPTVTALRVDGGPELDGDVASDPVWAAAVPATGFWQTQPSEGLPASEHTEVRIVYTASTLYVGVICYDRDPQAITETDSRRDSSLSDTDSFQFILDTFHDQQNGFVFGTNPAGEEYDGQLVNEGQGSGGFGEGRAQRGAGGGFNVNWDGSWEVRTSISERGWSAEFAIPFRSLRYPARSAQVWGINFQRTIRRRNEEAFWAPLPRQYNLFRLSLAGRLVGIEAPAQRNLQVTPYLLGRGLRTAARGNRTAWLGDVGGDVKWGIRPSVTLDLTYNTDFAQVEVDEQQINLDRFNLFFPEKRPFFLENAGLFAVGNSGQTRNDPAQTELFFSRRIGVGPNGEVIPILGGARLTAKVSDYSFGVMSMQTEAMTGLAPANNFTVTRLRRDLPNRSNIGAMMVTRQATGHEARARDYNRTYAVDGRLGVGRNGLISGWAARTDTPGREGDAQHGYSVVSEYNNGTFRNRIGFTELAPGFNPEAGFLTRVGFRYLDVGMFYFYRPKKFLHLQEIRPHATYNTFWNFDGFKETQATHLDWHWEFKNSSVLITTMDLNREGVRRLFAIFPGVTVPAATYQHQTATLSYTTNRGAPVSAGFRAARGGFFGGDRTTLGPNLMLRLGNTLSADVSWDRNDVTLPGGHFLTNLARTRVSYSFTPRLLVQALVQYNDRADLWSTNLRFSWIQRANTGLFVVYNDNRGIGDARPDTAGRSLVVKISQLLDVLR